MQHTPNLHRGKGESRKSRAAVAAERGQRGGEKKRFRTQHGHKESRPVLPPSHILAAIINFTKVKKKGE